MTTAQCPLNEQRATRLSFSLWFLCAIYIHHPIEGVLSSQLKITLNCRLCRLQKRSSMWSTYQSSSLYCAKSAGRVRIRFQQALSQHCFISQCFPSDTHQWHLLLELNKKSNNFIIIFALPKIIHSVTSVLKVFWFYFWFGYQCSDTEFRFRQSLISIKKSK